MGNINVIGKNNCKLKTTQKESDDNILNSVNKKHVDYFIHTAMGSNVDDPHLQELSDIKSIINKDLKVLEYQTPTNNNQTIFKFNTNDTYIGESKDEIPHGMGAITKKNSILQGEFENGNLINGKLAYNSGIEYKVHIIKNPFNYLIGTITDSENIEYVGDFENGLLCKGTLKYNNKVIYEGSLQNNIPLNKIIWVNSNKEVHLLSKVNEEFNGYGILTSGNNGTIEKYEGNFKGGKFHGLGIYKCSNGIRYDGYFINGKYERKGIYTLSDGSQFIAIFTAGIILDRATLILPTEQKIMGKFIGNNFFNLNDKIIASNIEFQQLNL